MKYFLLFLIRIYWLVPKKLRRHCIFKKKCSAFVYETTNKHGLIAGIKSCCQRFNQCRPNYGFYTSDDNEEWVILCDKTIVKRSETIL